MKSLMQICGQNYIITYVITVPPVFFLMIYPELGFLSNNSGSHAEGSCNTTRNGNYRCTRVTRVETFPSSRCLHVAFARTAQLKLLIFSLRIRSTVGGAIKKIIIEGCSGDVYPGDKKDNATESVSWTRNINKNRPCRAGKSLRTRRITADDLFIQKGVRIRVPPINISRVLQLLRGSV